PRRFRSLSELRPALHTDKIFHLPEPCSLTCAITSLIRPAFDTNAATTLQEILTAAARIICARQVFERSARLRERCCRAAPARPESRSARENRISHPWR